MKVLVLHNRYQLAGGEDGVVQAEKQLLEANGHQVHLLEVSNQDITGAGDKVVAAVSAIYSYSAKQKVSDTITSFRPDVVHVHNFFPLLSPSIYDACQEHELPVVQTLHNYRLACPKAMPFRDGKVCTDCIGEVIPWQSVMYGCYRSSRLQSSVVAGMITWHRLRGTWLQRVNAYIVFTQFQKEKMLQAGLPVEKIYIKPNFVFAPSVHQIEQRSDYLLFVGRLSEEKGVSVLIDAYIQHNLSRPLKIVGDGPLRQKLQQVVQNTSAENVIEFLGFQDKKTVFSLIRHAQFLVFPSIWFEGFPLAIAEAFACGLPVLASNLGGIAEIVEDGVTGFHFEAGNSSDLAAKIKWITNHPESISVMSNNARRTYEAKYTPEANYLQLIKIYQQL
ncbi:glycosyltransferase family 4 protein [Iningainema tapete]|uniref:Glycosyltransferase family 4 protein n=1 Tax=Iningainema tapete BLCC-T55 TaxID=2748662 RepID=A0A8J6XS83_9CYAN|nr:glycosyltransferase family 4 protein [Iningainema tapete]MBD2777379.1 glycosyltransferase family 4 protein [Iningainema tapete BLCC-T55]